MIITYQIIDAFTDQIQLPFAVNTDVCADPDAYAQSMLDEYCATYGEHDKDRWTVRRVS